MKEQNYPEGDLLDIAGAAEYLSISTKTVRRYIKAGRLRARKVRNVWFCPRTELDKLIESERPAATAAAAKLTPGADPALLDELRAAISNLDEHLKEIDKKLYLISQERENQHVRPDLIEKEQEIEFLKADNMKLIEELQRVKKEIADMKQNGPKDTMILKNKIEENEALKATIASNERGLTLLRREVEIRDIQIKKKDDTIQELKERLRAAEELASKRGATRSGLWKNRRAGEQFNYNFTGTSE